MYTLFNQVNVGDSFKYESCTYIKRDRFHAINSMGYALYFDNNAEVFQGEA